MLEAQFSLYSVNVKKRKKKNPQQSDAHLKGALGDSGKEETSNNRTRLGDGQLLWPVLGGAEREERKAEHKEMRTKHKWQDREHMRKLCQQQPELVAS